MQRLFFLKDLKDHDGRDRVAGTIATGIWVRGPELPEGLDEEGVLTMEDHRDLTLDHISRTSCLVARVEILKWA